MTNFMIIPGIEVNLLALVFISFGVGILSGFAGVGGAFLVVPALIILGFPANFAVGTSIAWVTGNSVVGAFRHAKLGNLDVHVGLIMIIATMSGVEVGVRIINRVRDIGLVDETALSIFSFMLATVGTYTLLESTKKKRELDNMLRKGAKPPPGVEAMSSRPKFQSINMPPMLRFNKSGVTMSLWVMLAIGFVVGMIMGIIGVGGGFIMVPALVYLIGLSSFMAVGTSLFQVVFSAAYGSIRHTMSGNVIIFASLIMLVASSIGTQLGVLLTRYVSGVSVRFVLGISILIASLATMLKLFHVVLETPVTWLELGSLVATLGSMGLALLLIALLFIMSIRNRRGQRIPNWVESLVAKQN